MYKKIITKEEINELPLFGFEGEVIMASHPDHIDNLIQKLETTDLVGFDTETKPTYKKGQFHHVALIQLAVADRVYLLSVQKSGITDRMVAFFENPGIIKVGIAIHDDLIAMQKRRSFRPAGFKDLNKIAMQLGYENIGARNLTAMILNKRISKRQQRSNWENIPLSTGQIQYAATDAWICREIYLRLKETNPSI